VIAYQTSDEPHRWLPAYLGIYNGSRCQTMASVPHSSANASKRPAESLNDLVRKHT